MDPFFPRPNGWAPPAGQQLSAGWKLFWVPPVRRRGGKEGSLQIPAQEIFNDHGFRGTIYGQVARRGENRITL